MFNKKENTIEDDQFISSMASKINEPAYDIRRIRRMEMNKDISNKEEVVNQLKMPVRMHRFREDARKHQRQITQQNHELMKMVNGLSKSVMDMGRFTIPLTSQSNTISKTLPGVVEGERLLPVVNLKLNTQFASSLIPQKFQIKDLYGVVPLKPSSIELEPSIYLDPNFQFFYYKESNEEYVEAFERLNFEDDGRGDLKKQILSVTYYLDFFDYVHMVRNQTLLKAKQEQNVQRYPKEILEIARATMETGGDNDQEQFNRDELFVERTQSFHRVFECDESELARPYDSIYFQNLSEFENFKMLREVEFKELKIYSEDIFLNTDVRNIISSEKIYLINIIEEIRLLIQLSKENREEYLLDKIHHNMTKKADQYLRLICGYTTSTLLIQFNVPNPYQKIYQFLKKSITYQKPYRELDKSVIEKYQVLELWYRIPEQLFGYSRPEIHQSLYNLIERTIEFEKKIQYMRRYEGLKVKKKNRKYEVNDK